MSLDSDILVIGAGPTGLTAALMAHAHGATVRIVDRRVDRTRPSRAMMLHSRALESLRPLGVTAALLERADTDPSARIHLGRRVLQTRLGNVDLADTAFPHLTLIQQASVEEVLWQALRDRGIEVEWGVAFHGHASTSAPSGPVAIELVTADGRSHQHRARFVAGCDGQGSAVREYMHAKWTGAPYPVEAVLADVELSGQLEPEVLHVAVDGPGLTFLFALGEGATWRMLSTRPVNRGVTTEFGGRWPSVPEGELHTLISRAGFGVTVESVRWSACVPLQHRVANPFRAGHMFLAGDAAHAHSPAGGQGMNNGILDSINLGWKLAFATGADRETLLDSYDLERRKAAGQVLALTHLIFFAEASPHPVARLIRTAALPLVAPLIPVLLRWPPVKSAGVRLLSQRYVHYRHSGISQDCARRGTRWPRPGSRLPDRTVISDDRVTRLHELTSTPGVHVLMERGATTMAARISATDTKSRITIHRLTDYPGTSVLGVRPDGYVGFRSDHEDDRLLYWLRLVGAL